MRGGGQVFSVERVVSCAESAWRRQGFARLLNARWLAAGLLAVILLASCGTDDAATDEETQAPLVDATATSTSTSTPTTTSTTVAPPEELFSPAGCDDIIAGLVRLPAPEREAIAAMGGAYVGRVEPRGIEFLGLDVDEDPPSAEHLQWTPTGGLVEQNPDEPFIDLPPDMADWPWTVIGGPDDFECESTPPSSNLAPTTTESEALDASAWLTVDAFAGHTFDSAPLEAALESGRMAFGPPQSDGVNENCGAGPLRIVQWEGLDLLSRGDTIDGWVYRGTTPVMATPSGVTIGTTVAELQELFPEGRVLEQSLGPEFFLDVDTTTGPRFLGALLDGSGPDGRVTSLFAGLTCFFR